MVRIGAFFVGLFFAGWLLISFLFGAAAYVSDPPQPTVEHEFHKAPKHVSFSFDGPFGRYDRQQLQRGFQVFKEVCSACHSLKFVAFRDLEALGYNEAEVKAIAKQWAIKTPDVDPATGEMSTRDPVPADHFPKPFANNVAAAAANNNAIPPDLSLMTKARHHGSAYVYSLITGYQPQPAELLREFPDAKTPEGLHYNPYFANLNLAMAPPLTADGQVRNCLFARSESDLRAALRDGVGDEELAQRWVVAMRGKAAGHGIDDPTFLQPDRPMSAIGG